jgi:gamma-glutamyltranspeptidase/glutathione hydrolase
VAVAGGLADAIRESAGVHDDPGMRTVFAPTGAPLAAGDLLRQPALATTLRCLATGGPRAFYAGELADTLLDGLAARGCTLTADDLERYAPVVEEPLRGRYAGVDLLTSPPNSSGVLVLQALAALEALALADPLGGDAALLASILRAGNVQRERQLADPRTWPFDPGAWLGEARIDELVDTALGATPAEAGGVARPRPDGDTVAVVVADGDGGAVSLIQSLYHSFGAQILEPVTGVLVHNRGGAFSLEPGHPNELAPGRRPAHTLMPVIVEREGRLLGVLGTMGGRVQAQIHLQMVLHLLAGATPQEAVDAPRWIVGPVEAGDGDGTVRIEDGVDAVARAALGGLDLQPIDVHRGSDDLGHAQAIWTEPELHAGSDHRADGAAIAGARA